jgi:trans-aconitate methyltransferase
MSQTWDPQRYARDAGFVAELGKPVVDLLAPQPGERVLDLGCGEGALTAHLVSLGCQVVGVDASPEQVEAARRQGLDARVADGQALDVGAEFDAVFSNAALHWMKRDPDAVIAGVWRALRPGGRFVGELGGHGCVARVQAALLAGLERRGIDGRAHHPWYFPTDDEYRQRLESGGFRVREIRLFPRPTPLPGDIVAWLEVFAGSFLAPLPEAERPGFLAEVRAELAPALRGPDGVWTVDYVRLRFSAVKPA